MYHMHESVCMRCYRLINRKHFEPFWDDLNASCARVTSFLRRCKYRYQQRKLCLLNNRWMQYKPGLSVLLNKLRTMSKEKAIVPFIQFMLQNDLNLSEL